MTFNVQKNISAHAPDATIAAFVVAEIVQSQYIVSIAHCLYDNLAEQINNKKVALDLISLDGLDVT